MERSLLGLVSFQVFRPSPCMTCFVLLDMGLGPRFHDFFSLKAPHCALDVVLCLDFDPFFFLLLFRCHVFFKIIYLVIVSYE